MGDNMNICKKFRQKHQQVSFAVHYQSINQTNKQSINQSINQSLFEESDNNELVALYKYCYIFKKPIIISNLIKNLFKI